MASEDALDKVLSLAALYFSGLGEFLNLRLFVPEKLFLYYGLPMPLPLPLPRPLPLPLKLFPRPLPP